VIYEAVIQFRVGPVRVTLADPSVPLEPVRRPDPPAPEPEAEPESVPVIDLEEARREAERARQEQADREERERLDGVLAQLLDAVRDLRAAQRGRLEEMQRVAVEVAVAVASHVLYERLESGDFPVEELVRAAVSRLEPRQAVTVRLHPDDLALLERRTAEEPLFAADAAELRLVADAALGRGDCRAETGDVAVMANLQEHLAEIRRDLLHALPEAEVERRMTGGERGLRRYPDRRATA
jgi:flagellar biosynthesis/type III secretory pathway protein FliH